MENFNYYLEKNGEIGFVELVSESFAHTTGLPGLKPGEIVIFEDGTTGQALDIKNELAEILIFSKTAPKVGTKAVRTNEYVTVSLSNELLGRTLNAFGSAIDSKDPIVNIIEKRLLENPVPGISTRKKISATLETGTIIVDMMIPLGVGQRELIIGDRKTGKTSFLRRTLLTQASQGTVCIYALIGKKSSDVKDLENHLNNSSERKNIILIASTSQEPASVIHLTPYTAMTIAEFFRDQGKNVLVILDDLSTHAKFYRETSLLARRFPGRDSYPGDIFYLHSRLLERAGNFFFEKSKESAISCLPIVETTEGDLTGYIQTNLMSMTDGHIFFDSDLFSKGRRPAINHSLSVTRVGRQTQNQLKKDINHELSSILALYEKSESFSHFGAGLSESVKFALKTGERILKFFDQQADDSTPINVQIFCFTLLWRSFWQNRTAEEMKRDIEKIVATYKADIATKEYIDMYINNSKVFNELLNAIDQKRDEIVNKFTLNI